MRLYSRGGFPGSPSWQCWLSAQFTVESNRAAVARNPMQVKKHTYNSQGKGCLTHPHLPRSSAHRSLDLVHYASCMTFACRASGGRGESVLLGAGHGDGGLVAGMRRHGACSLWASSLDEHALLCVEGNGSWPYVSLQVSESICRGYSPSKQQSASFVNSICSLHHNARKFLISTS